jgi:hypothetical protein
MFASLHFWTYKLYAYIYMYILYYIYIYNNMNPTTTTGIRMYLTSWWNPIEFEGVDWVHKKVPGLRLKALGLTRIPPVQGRSRCLRRTSSCRPVTQIYIIMVSFIDNYIIMVCMMCHHIIVVYNYICIIYVFHCMMMCTYMLITSS